MHPPPPSSVLPCTCSWLFVHERSAGAPAEVAAADVPLASSLPGLVSTVTLHLEEGIYSVQSACLCVRQSAHTQSLGRARGHICGMCVCVFVGLHANTFLCVCAGAFSDYSNRSDSHQPEKSLTRLPVLTLAYRCVVMIMYLQILHLLANKKHFVMHILLFLKLRVNDTAQESVWLKD